MTQARRQRILLTVDAVGGVWQYCLDLARALGEHKVETVLALLGPAPSEDQRAELRTVPHAKLVETGLQLDWLSDGPKPVLAAGVEVMRLAEREQVDLVQLNMPTLAAVAPPTMPVLAVTHGCVSTWWQAARPGQALDREYRWHRALMGEGLRAADRVVAPSAAYARVIARHYQLPRTPDVVHNGRTSLASATSLAADDTVLTVARLWDQVKNAQLLDRVAAGLAVPFYAAGALKGPHGETVQLDHLQALGQIDSEALAQRLARRPVFVSAASFEPFGLSVLEAAAAGCPLVLSDIPTFRELWDGSALFVETDDEAGYVRTIEQVIGDPALRMRLSQAARARAARYTPAAMAEKMLGIYAELLEPRTPAGKVAA